MSSKPQWTHSGRLSCRAHWAATRFPTDRKASSPPGMRKCSQRLLRTEPSRADLRPGRWPPSAVLGWLCQASLHEEGCPLPSSSPGRLPVHGHAAQTARRSKFRPIPKPHNLQATGTARAETTAPAEGPGPFRPRALCCSAPPDLTQQAPSPGAEVSKDAHASVLALPQPAWLPGTHSAEPSCPATTHRACGSGSPQGSHSPTWILDAHTLTMS